MRGSMMTDRSMRLWLATLCVGAALLSGPGHARDEGQRKQDKTSLAQSIRDAREHVRRDHDRDRRHDNRHDDRRDWDRRDHDRRDWDRRDHDRRDWDRRNHDRRDWDRRDHDRRDWNRRDHDRRDWDRRSWDRRTDWWRHSRHTYYQPGWHFQNGRYWAPPRYRGSQCSDRRHYHGVHYHVAARDYYDYYYPRYRYYGPQPLSASASVIISVPLF